MRSFSLVTALMLGAQASHDGSESTGVTSSGQPCQITSVETYQDPQCSGAGVPVDPSIINVASNQCSPNPSAAMPGYYYKAVCQDAWVDLQFYFDQSGYSDCSQSDLDYQLVLPYEQCTYARNPFTQQNEYFMVRSASSATSTRDPSMPAGPDVILPSTMAAECEARSLSFYQDAGCSRKVDALSAEQEKMALAALNLQLAVGVCTPSMIQPGSYALMSCTSKNEIAYSGFMDPSCTQPVNSLPISSGSCFQTGDGYAALEIGESTKTAQESMNEIYNQMNATNGTGFDDGKNQWDENPNEWESQPSNWTDYPQVMNGTVEMPPCYLNDIKLFKDDKCSYEFPVPPSEQSAWIRSINEQLVTKKCEYQQSTGLFGQLKCLSGYEAMQNIYYDEVCQREYPMSTYFTTGRCLEYPEKIEGQQFWVIFDIKSNDVEPPKDWNEEKPPEVIYNNTDYTYSPDKQICEIKKVVVFDDPECRYQMDMPMPPLYDLNRNLHSDICESTPEGSSKSQCQLEDVIVIQKFKDSSCQEQYDLQVHTSNDCVPVDIGSRKVYYQTTIGAPTVETIDKPELPGEQPNQYEQKAECKLVKQEFFQDSECIMRLEPKEQKKEEPVRACMKNLLLYQDPECAGNSPYPPADVKLNEYNINLTMIITECEDGLISMNFGPDEYFARNSMPLQFRFEAQNGIVKCVPDSSNQVFASFTLAEKEPVQEPVEDGIKIGVCQLAPSQTFYQKIECNGVFGIIINEFYDSECSRYVQQQFYTANVCDYIPNSGIYVKNYIEPASQSNDMLDWNEPNKDEQNWNEPNKDEQNWDKPAEESDYPLCIVENIQFFDGPSCQEPIDRPTMGMVSIINEIIRDQDNCLSDFQPIFFTQFVCKAPRFIEMNSHSSSGCSDESLQKKELIESGLCVKAPTGREDNQYMQMTITYPQQEHGDYPKPDDYRPDYDPSRPPESICQVKQMEFFTDSECSQRTSPPESALPLLNIYHGPIVPTCTSISGGSITYQFSCMDEYSIQGKAFYDDPTCQSSESSYTLDFGSMQCNKLPEHSGYYFRMEIGSSGYSYEKYDNYSNHSMPTQGPDGQYNLTEMGTPPICQVTGLQFFMDDECSMMLPMPEQQLSEVLSGANMQLWQGHKCENNDDNSFEIWCGTETSLTFNVYHGRNCDLDSYQKQVDIYEKECAAFPVQSKEIGQIYVQANIQKFNMDPNALPEVEEPKEPERLPTVPQMCKVMDFEVFADPDCTENSNKSMDASMLENQISDLNYYIGSSVCENKARLSCLTKNLIEIQQYDSDECITYMNSTFVSSGQCFKPNENRDEYYRMNIDRDAEYVPPEVFVNSNQKCKIADMDFYYDSNCTISMSNVTDENYPGELRDQYNEVLGQCSPAIETLGMLSCLSDNSLGFFTYPIEEQICLATNYIDEGPQAPVLFRSGMCTPFNGSYIKAEIGPNNRFNESIVPEPPLPKLQLKTVNIFEQKNFSQEEDEFNKKPPEEKKQVLTQSFQNNMKSTIDSFLNLNYSGVPETNCVASIDTFEPSSPFDYTCAKKGGVFGSDDSAELKTKYVEYLNEASTGKCVNVEEPELKGPWSMTTQCMKGGLKMLVYMNALNCNLTSNETSQFGEVILPWNFCYNGEAIIKFKQSQQVQQSQLLDKTSGISVEEKNINKKISNSSETIVIASIIVSGVVSVVLIGVITYMCTRQKVSKGFTSGPSYPMPDGKSIDSSKEQNIQYKSNGQEMNHSALQLQNSVLYTNNVVEMSIYENKNIDDSVDFPDNQNSIDKKEGSQTTLKV